jgi:hypothetical protein
VKTEVVQAIRGEESREILRLEQAWIRKTLILLGVSLDVLDRVQQDPQYPAQAWRNYLLDNFGLEIVKDRQTNNVQIFRLNMETKERTILGQWNYPEIQRAAEKGKPSRLVLRYRP